MRHLCYIFIGLFVGYLIFSDLFRDVEYRRNGPACDFYDAAGEVVIGFKLTEYECSLLEGGENGVIALSLNPITGDLVSVKDHSKVIRIRLLMRPEPLKQGNAVHGIVSLSDVQFPERVGSKFSYRVRGGGYASASAGAKYWSVSRLHEGRAVIYTYPYNTAPFKYVERKIIEFLNKIN